MTADGVVLKRGLDAADGLLGACHGVADDQHAGTGLGGAGDFSDEIGVSGVEVFQVDDRFMDRGIGDGVMRRRFSDDLGD